MALYWDAASVLEGIRDQGSLKSRIYGPKADFRSKPAHVYALITETAKYDTFLKEVIENAGILAHEPKVTPLLSLLLVHDFCFAKGGIAASSNHPLRLAVERHKARLQAEITKARIRRKRATLEALKTSLTAEKVNTSETSNNVRWVRVNAAKSSVREQLQSTFVGYQTIKSISEVANAPSTAKILKVDHTLPELLALPPDLDLTRTDAYSNGELILQDKASCFPAHLLLGNQTLVGDVIDACAAPGNKTTHLSALLHKIGHVSNIDMPRTIFACERNPVRSKTLQSMTVRAGASHVEILANQDFLALDPQDPRFGNVTHLLLDPSCSGSGIRGREDIPVLALPEDKRSTRDLSNRRRFSKKRKRESLLLTKSQQTDESLEYERTPSTEMQDMARLEKLAGLQARIIKHAFRFPSAAQVSYSTCSVHVQENEAVVACALQNNDWKILRRSQQVEGLKNWPTRGVKTSPLSCEDTASPEQLDAVTLSVDELDACIRCYPGNEECTMGFFVCGFVRDQKPGAAAKPRVEADWEGFSDQE